MSFYHKGNSFIIGAENWEILVIFKILSTSCLMYIYFNSVELLGSRNFKIEVGGLGISSTSNLQSVHGFPFPESLHYPKTEKPMFKNTDYFIILAFVT